jgi:hypothetical protein
MSSTTIVMTTFQKIIFPKLAELQGGLENILAPLILSLYHLANVSKSTTQL